MQHEEAPEKAVDASETVSAPGTSPGTPIAFRALVQAAGCFSKSLSTERRAWVKSELECVKFSGLHVSHDALKKPVPPLLDRTVLFLILDNLELRLRTKTYTLYKGLHIGT